ncbi:G/T mismatch-specific thymine DNA glycosylase isoform X2 [Rhipicephalus sanguineus]|nr:G/T mismatch-specific thymine DNA glycosylase isoform X2 [Rhipicephalus sanguineus]XP_037528908.1 G/T mismatch-specific thymine DNA glycosylase isoform X2 [Rhipicephalus sanguineus]XP_049275693.1 G/T mismatch-specific thymine DNA glycosylase isoform X2 [Rhipicephalus sanguineus]
MNGEGRSMDNYRGSVQTWNPPVAIKQEPEYDLYGETAQSHHHRHLQHTHQQQNPSSHHSGSEFVRSPYFQQQYMMPAENGCHYHMTEVGQPEEEEHSPGTHKKRGRKKKIKAEDQELPLGLEPGQPVPVIRKRGRPRKYPIAEGLDNPDDGRRPLKQEKITDSFKQRKRIDRFEGMPEEEVAKRTLPDHLVPNLDIVIIGINPGLFAAFKGHHYAGPGNHFWRCLFLAGLIPEPMTAVDDFKLIHYGIGFTNIVARTTRSSADLSRKEIKEGAEILLDKLKIFQPRIAVFNGKGIYEIFSGNKNFVFGRQPEPIEGTNVSVFVMPSSSARCAQLPRAVDKLPFYVALKKLRDHLRGHLPMLHPSEVTFPDVKLKVEAKEEPCDDEDAATNESDPFSTEGTDDGSSGYDGSNTFHVQIKEEPGSGDHPVPGSYLPDPPKRRGRKKKTETAASQSDYSLARASIGMQPPVLTQQQRLQPMHHHTAQLPNNQMAQPTMHSQQDMPQQQMDYHSSYYSAQCNQQPYYQQDGFPDQAPQYGQWNSGAQQPEYPCQQPAEPSPPGSNWAYPSTYSEDLCRAAEFPSWLKQEPQDSCDTGGSYC